MASKPGKHIEGEVFVNRELSWLSFNHRVLQEATDPNVPLLERLKFLAIYANNLDEFFKVRVATIKRLEELKKTTKKKLKESPGEVLQEIQYSVLRQRKEFNRIFREEILRELSGHNVFFLNDNLLSQEQRIYVNQYFHNHVKPLLAPFFLADDDTSLFLRDNWLYFAILLKRDKSIVDDYALLPFPEELPRFIKLPVSGASQYVMYVDDIIRLHLLDLFPSYDKASAYATRVLRDAELDIEGEVSESLLKTIRESLKQREKGEPTRLSHDPEIPDELLQLLSRKTDIEADDPKFARKYHDFTAFFNFPDMGLTHEKYKPLTPLPHPAFKDARNYFDVVREQDHLLHLPYQKFDYVIEWIRQAADDPHMTHIYITLYRLAKQSQVVHELLNALQKGKPVTVIIELKARFDEASNIYWARLLEDAGAEVLYSLLRFKVHSKVLLFSRNENGQTVDYAYFSTGNFNEDTAQLYSDTGMFTSDTRLTQEAKNLFLAFNKPELQPTFNHLLVAPFDLRKKLYAMIDNEIKQAKAGNEAYIVLKMNSMQDKKIIRKLYQASQAGVRIQLILRSHCCLVPGVQGLSENIEAISIVDRILEHSRVYIFCNEGDELMYVSSADWMTRNLDHRIEVAYPVYNQATRNEIRSFINIQLKENVKARIIDRHQNNQYRVDNQAPLRSQYRMYELMEEKSSAGESVTE